MQCKCGEQLTESTHTVTTEEGKLRWIEYAPKNDIDIQQWICKSCKRVHYKVWDGIELLKVFG